MTAIIEAREPKKNGTSLFFQIPSYFIKTGQIQPDKKYKLVVIEETEQQPIGSELLNLTPNKPQVATKSKKNMIHWCSEHAAQAPPIAV